MLAENMKYDHEVNNTMCRHSAKQRLSFNLPFCFSEANAFGQNHSCPEHYVCKAAMLCIPQDLICNGHSNCPLGEDEHHCAVNCPEKCNCFDHVVNCTKSQLISLDNVDNSSTAMDFSFSFQAPGTELSEFPYLFYLNLEGANGVQPSTFMNLKNLRHLDISQTSLKRMSVNYVENLRHLRALKFKGNHLSRIPENLLSNLKRLEILDMSKTGLSELNDKQFENSFRLRELYLSGNKISKIKESTFQMLTELEVLDLGENPIKETERYSFWFLTSLKSLVMPTAELCCMTKIAEARKVCQVRCQISFSRKVYHESVLFQWWKIILETGNSWEMKSSWMNYKNEKLYGKTLSAHRVCAFLLQSQFQANETTECRHLIKDRDLRFALVILTFCIIFGNLTVVITKLCKACGQAGCKKFPRDMPTASLALCYFYQVDINKSLSHFSWTCAALCTSLSQNGFCTKTFLDARTIVWHLVQKTLWHFGKKNKVETLMMRTLSSVCRVCTLWWSWRRTVTTTWRSRRSGVSGSRACSAAWLASCSWCPSKSPVSCLSYW